MWFYICPQILWYSSLPIPSNWAWILLSDWLRSKRIKWGTSLVVHWLRLHGPYAGGTGLSPGWGIHLRNATKKKKTKQTNKKKTKQNPKTSKNKTKSGNNGMQLQRLGHRGNCCGIFTWWTIATIWWAAIWRSPYVEKLRDWGFLKITMGILCLGRGSSGPTKAF